MMEAAIAVARTYSIPKATLKRRFDGKNSCAVGHKQIIGGRRYIPEDIEEELKNHILKFEERMF
jgi:hypothetical protein